MLPVIPDMEKFWHFIYTGIDLFLFIYFIYIKPHLLLVPQIPQIKSCVNSANTWIFFGFLLLFFPVFLP